VTEIAAALTSPLLLVMVAPLPSRTIPFVLGMDTSTDHVAEHGPGKVTVSPELALLMAVCTLALEQLVAAMVAADAWPPASHTSAAKARGRRISFLS